MTEFNDYLQPQAVALIVAIVVAALILSFGLIVLWAMWKKTIDLGHLLSEAAAPDGSPPKASLSRFQFLIFTFVIAGLYLVLSLETGTMIEVPNGTLVLLGISGGTYVASKAMSGQGPVAPASSPPAEDPAAAGQPAAAAQQAKKGPET